MKRLVMLLKGRRGNGLIFTFILLFVILTLTAMVIEAYRMDTMYEQVDYVLRRGVYASVEYAMLDEYRRDRYAKMDSGLAIEKLYEYFYETMKLDQDLNKYSNGKWVYSLEIESLTADDDPPELVLRGYIKTHSIFSLLTGEVRLPFTLTSGNIRTEEGEFP